LLLLRLPSGVHATGITVPVRAELSNVVAPNNLCSGAAPDGDRDSPTAGLNKSAVAALS